MLGDTDDRWRCVETTGSTDELAVVDAESHVLQYDDAPDDTYDIDDDADRAVDAGVSSLSADAWYFARRSDEGDGGPSTLPRNDCDAINTAF